MEATRRATARSEAAIRRLRQADVQVGIMAQITRCNSSTERLPRLLQWMRELDDLEITSARLHILEIENDAVRAKYGLSVEENIAVLNALLDLRSKEKVEALRGVSLGTTHVDELLARGQAFMPTAKPEGASDDDKGKDEAKAEKAES